MWTLQSCWSGRSTHRIARVCARILLSSSESDARKQHLYNYFTCDAPECSHIDNQYDLCYECYAQFRSGAKIHPSSHTMSEHHNGLYTIKILGAIVAVLCILRFLMARVI